MRVGVYGGTFDPVHLGHLVLAEQCREQAKLDEVWFIPAARPPHKQEQRISTFQHRVEMLSLALAGNPAFRINELEKDRPGPSYTADTLAELHDQYPEIELALLMGSDCLPDLAHWYKPAQILELALLVVVARPGFEMWDMAQIRGSLKLAADKEIRVQLIHLPEIDLASRTIRSRNHEHRTIRYLVPRAVECYIETHSLYRD